MNTLQLLNLCRASIMTIELFFIFLMGFLIFEYFVNLGGH